MQFVTNVLTVTFVGLTLTFVLLNLFVGCETWEDPVCITPAEMISYF